MRWMESYQIVYFPVNEISGGQEKFHEYFAHEKWDYQGKTKEWHSIINIWQNE